MSKSNFTDKELKAALAEYRDAMLAATPEPEELPFEPSPRYKANMARLLRKMERKERLHRYAQRAAAAVLVLIFGSGAFIGLNGEARADFLAWIHSTYENSVIYRYTAADSIAPLPKCELTWIPEGYELVSSERNDDSLVMVYENNIGLGFMFACDRVANDGIMQITPSGEHEASDVIINGMHGELYMSLDEKSTNDLILFDSDENFVYTIDCFLEKSDILHIAEGIKITK